ncbi:SURF1 family cytochrome oxidase biogenesis protein [Sphingomonas abaci]|uniref:SURF1-like protein n=1 Tax=Sphingomonas abaci TaxID=237611 RepID=A0A7W7EYK7_9SPHN|nr:surfeit locus 1 family protein [Sphingomonas abaci]
MTGARARPGLVVAIVAAVGLLVGLGVWQVERLAWKRALIAQTRARLAAAPVPAPGPADWRGVGPGDAYRRLRVTGRYQVGADTLTQAVTGYGPGFWVLTPFRSDTGFVLLVNRGFVPSGTKPTSPPAGPVTVTGLLRLTEPKGGFLRSNVPASDRWYSRDVAAIAARRGLGTVAPYFIDSDRTAPPGRWPEGGLTVVRFPNNHLSYALTWFGLAALVAFMGWRALRRG